MVHSHSQQTRLSGFQIFLLLIWLLLSAQTLWMDQMTQPVCHYCMHTNLFLEYWHFLSIFFFRNILVHAFWRDKHSSQWKYWTVSKKSTSFHHTLYFTCRYWTLRNLMGNWSTHQEAWSRACVNVFHIPPRFCIFLGRNLISIQSCIWCNGADHHHNHRQSSSSFNCLFNFSGLEIQLFHTEFRFWVRPAVKQSLVSTSTRTTTCLHATR